MRAFKYVWLLPLAACSLPGEPAGSQPPPPPGGGATSYQGIPEGFDFPAKNTDLEKFRQDRNVPEMRRHAWNVWAGLNQTAQGGGPIWETWFRVDETFAPGAGLQGERKHLRKFAPPRQHLQPGTVPQAAGESLLSMVLFNQELHAHVRGRELYKATKLDAINASFTAATPLPERKIPDFERKSMALKVVWWPVKKSGKTALPNWDFDPARPDAQGNPPYTWKRFLAVDPTRSHIPANETATVDFTYRDPTLGVRTLQKEGCPVVSLSSFYHFALSTQAELEAAQAISLQALELGDYVAMIGMHVTTREIDDWVWATFWWHDRPDVGPYAGNRTENVTGVWRNYLMDVAFDMVTPREADGGANACYNPWLEARFKRGLVSNCMTCHQRSVWPPEHFEPVTRDGLGPTDPYFQGKTKLDFLWSVGDRSQ